MRIAFALALILAVLGPARAAEERVGDRVFFVRDKPGAATKFQMIVNAGCLDEAGSQCRGMAHYLEHIVLVGRNPEHRDSAVRMFSGASANGWTSSRATVYLSPNWSSSFASMPRV
jgi:zinc protease